MNDKLTPQERMILMKIKKKYPSFMEEMNLEGIFFLEKWTKKKSGNHRKVLEFPFHNSATGAGRNYLLNAGFKGVSQLTAWFAGLIDNSGFASLNSADTLASKSWSEFAGYSQTTRPAWSPPNATAQLLSNNAALCVFDITVTGNLYGGFITSDSTKGGSGGTLWTTGPFGSVTPVTADLDQIRVAYNLGL